ncbi:MAG: hypothetical protein H6739_28240 [Alphaproteobacteria bacterium]|nr:hypothetical protein [Alphaproteobacteria bacterium]
MLPTLLATCLPPNLAHYAHSRELSRPSMSGPVETVDSPDGRFRVHYTDYGDDAMDINDNDGDGVPDAVTRILVALDIGADAFEARGWRSLEPDNAWGGSDAIDVYVGAIDANGYAYPALPDDPDAVSSCYLEINAGLTGGSSVVLESVVVHELHHCVQFAYTVNSHAWMYESTATYEQYQPIEGDELDLLVNFLWALRLNQPDRPIHGVGDRYEYAGMLFPKFWAERGGTDLGRLDALWTVLGETPGWRVGIDVAASELFNTSLDGVFLDYSVWNAFACGRDDGQHYDPDVLPCTVDAGVPITPIQAGDSFEVVHENTSHTALYFELPADGDDRAVAVSCDAPGDEAEAAVRIVALDGGGAEVGAASASVKGGEALAARLSEGLPPDGAALLVFVSTGDVAAEQTCEVTRVAAEIPGRCATMPASSTPWLAALLLFAARRRRGEAVR